MAIKCEEYGCTALLTLTGDLAGEHAAELKKQAERYIDEKQIVEFVIDLENADFIDSEGLESLLWLKRRCEDCFGQLKLATVDENCQKILEITRLAHQFDAHPDVASALKTLR